MGNWVLNPTTGLTPTGQKPNIIMPTVLGKEAQDKNNQDWVDKFWDTLPETSGKLVASGAAVAPNAATGGSAGGITMPTRTKWSDVYEGIANTLGTPATVVAPTLEKLSPLAGFDDDYFNSMYDSAKNKLYKEYYGPSGTKQRTTETMASRGMLGSTVEQRGMSELDNSYGTTLAESLADINRLKTEKAVESAQQLQTLQNQRDIAGSQMSLEASGKNADLGMSNKELAVRSALTEAADTTKFDLGTFEQQVNLEDITGKRSSEQRQLLGDLLGNPDVNLTPEQTSYILDTIFGGTSGGSGTSGATGTASSTLTSPTGNYGSYQEEVNAIMSNPAYAGDSGAQREAIRRAAQRWGQK